jgi:hypothetical protein
VRPACPLLTAPFWAFFRTALALFAVASLPEDPGPLAAVLGLVRVTPAPVLEPFRAFTGFPVTTRPAALDAVRRLLTDAEGLFAGEPSN